jgi:hypothetical protein
VTVLRRIGTGLSHELNNRLSVVTTHCEMLLQTLDPQSETARDLEAMRRAAATGSEALRSFDVLADLHPKGWDGVDVEGVLRRLERALAYVAGAGARLSLDIDRPGRRTAREPAALERLVLVAATLVRDAMTEGGDVHVVATSTVAPPGVRPSLTIEVRGEPRDDTPGDAARSPRLDAPRAGPIASAYLRSLADDLGGALDEARAPTGAPGLRIELPLDASTPT